MKQGIFLDADGVLWPDIKLGGIMTGFDKAKQNLTKLRSSIVRSEKYSFLVVSNQTLAARNLIPEYEFREFVSDFFEKLIDLELLDDYKICFHHPRAINKNLRSTDCLCRKPRPGMINELLLRHHLSPDKSVIVGDRITDVIAGQLAGLSIKVLLSGSRSFELNDSFISESMLTSIRLFAAKDLTEVATIINKWRIDD